MEKELNSREASGPSNEGLSSNEGLASNERRSLKSRSSKTLATILSETAQLWLAGHAPSQSAALAFYTLFSMGPVLVLTVSVAGSLAGTEAARREVSLQVEQLLGSDTARAVVTVLESADRPDLAGWAGLAGALALFIGATAVFSQLQDALNSVWGVEPRRGRVVRGLLLKRLVSFGLVLSLGFLLLVSLVASAAIAALSEAAQRRFEGLAVVFPAVDLLVSLALVACLFAVLYRVLPDAEIAWKDAWVGGGSTALLFVAGKFLIGWYLGRSDAASVYGVAGSLVLSLFWIYYSSMLLLAGAGFTRVWSQRHGDPLPEPEEGAQRVSP